MLPGCENGPLRSRVLGYKMLDVGVVKIELSQDEWQ